MAERFLGVDLGIASCGWALIEQGGEAGRIVAWGARCFDAPETPKERRPLNALRRQFRGMRRVIRRRRQRMAAIRALFASHGLLPTTGCDALRGEGLDPWALRADGLDRALTPREFAVALGHIARHRGFRSNAKTRRNEEAETGRVKAGIERNRLGGGWRTLGEMFARDARYAGQKRNRDGEYTRSVLREDHEHEVRVLFARQRVLGNALATDGLEQAFAGLAFDQRDPDDSEHMVGFCGFERDQRRAARRSYSFELFRFLSRLTALRLRDGRDERALTPDEIARAEDGFGRQRGMTFARLRKALALPEAVRFADVPAGEEAKRDVVNRASSNGCAMGSHALREAVGEAAWRTLLGAPEQLDALAFVLSFREAASRVRAGVEALGLPDGVAEAVMEAFARGDLGEFAGAGHISAKACRAVIPGLRRGLVYSAACAAAGYDHAAQAETALADVANPVARRAIGEALRQVRAIVAAHGLPDRIHVELARDVGKSPEEREEIRRGIEKRNKELDRLRAAFRETVGRDPRGRDSGGREELLRFELWREQNGRCLYTDTAIPPDAIAAGDNRVQVDHILPWSRFNDDSFVNKTLCFASANQEKRRRTPHEWFGDDPRRWETFAAAVEGCRAMKGRKKRNYLLRAAAEMEAKFSSRNLNDTRYAARVVLQQLRRLYVEDGTVRVFSRPGQLTDRLRRAWGVQDLKKQMEPDGEKRRHDDRHHALDALICAATSQSALQRLTRAFQEAEERGSHRDFSAFPPPWPGFVAELREKFPHILVCRAERGRARGEAHGATIRRVVGTPDGPAVVGRKRVADLTLADLDCVKDPERNAAVVAALRAWLDAGKPKDAPPLSPKGDAMRKVQLVTTKKVDVEVRGGAADRGEMVRVDVFRKRSPKGAWQFFLVPIYPHQVADREGWPEPPMRAVKGRLDEPEWPKLDAGHQFLWSLSQRSFVELVKPDGTEVGGYFMGLDRSTGAITLSAPHSTKALARSIGAQTLRSFRKFHVDRLGGRHEIERETRTWRGVACT